MAENPSARLQPGITKVRVLPSPPSHHPRQWRNWQAHHIPNVRVASSSLVCRSGPQHHVAVAQLAERHLAKVEVAGSEPVSHSTPCARRLAAKAPDLYSGDREFESLRAFYTQSFCIQIRQ